MAYHGAGIVWSDLLGAAGTNQLPGDLLVQILIRIPVKSILCFKSVCRAWYFLFSSPIFIQQHSFMTSSSTKLTTLSSFLVHTKSYYGNAHIFSLLTDPFRGSPMLTNLKTPFEGDLSCINDLFYLDHIMVLGCINGLVCLSICSNGTAIVLWNPAIRKHCQIPHPQLLLGGDERALLGFSYDETTESYKVVRILQSSSFEANRPSMIEVYSTGTNSWRTLKVASLPWFEVVTKCFAGVPYWIAMDTESDFEDLFVWFDPSAEAFGFQPIPFDGKDDEWCVNLDAMGEHPVVVYSDFKNISEERNNPVDIVMRLDIGKLNKRKDGGKESICVEKIAVEPELHLTKIVGFQNNGEIIALDQYKDLVAYDYESSQTKHLPSYGNWGLPRFYDYIESLVWPF